MLSHPGILHGFKKVEYFNWVRRTSVNLTIERSNSIKTSKYDVVLTINIMIQTLQNHILLSYLSHVRAIFLIFLGLCLENRTPKGTCVTLLTRAVVLTTKQGLLCFSEERRKVNTKYTYSNIKHH